MASLTAIAREWGLGFVVRRHREMSAQGGFGQRGWEEVILVSGCLPWSQPPQ